MNKGGQKALGRETENAFNPIESKALQAGARSRNRTDDRLITSNNFSWVNQANCAKNVPLITICFDRLPPPPSDGVTNIASSRRTHRDTGHGQKKKPGIAGRGLFSCGLQAVFWGKMTMSVAVGCCCFQARLMFSSSARTSWGQVELTTIFPLSHLQ